MLLLLLLNNEDFTASLTVNTNLNSDIHKTCAGVNTVIFFMRRNFGFVFRRRCVIFIICSVARNLVLFVGVKRFQTYKIGGFAEFDIFGKPENNTPFSVIAPKLIRAVRTFVN